MKKVLSVFLAVLMVFSVMAISVSAEGGDDTTTTTAPANTTTSQYFGPGLADAQTQCVFRFVMGAGKCKSGQDIYDKTTGKVVSTAAEDVPPTWVRIPAANEFTVNTPVTLPSVKAPNGQTFVGWQRVPGMAEDPADNRIYSAGPGQYTVKSVDIGKVVEFRAVYEEGEMEEDTFAKVFSILTKIFGALIGVIAYQGNIDKGQQFMEKIFSSISG